MAERTSRTAARPAGRRRDWLQHPSFAIEAWIATRVVVSLVLAWTIATSHQSMRQALGHWDVEHFVGIARDGYADPKEMAFFPGLPALMHLGGLTGLDERLVGLGIAIVCSALAAWALYRLAGAVGTALWLAAPMTVFTFVGYTEAPFCAAAFWAWERARAGRWWQAALLAAAACTFRVSGLFLVGALVVLALVGDGDRSPVETRPAALPRRLDTRIGDALWLVLPLMVLAGYVTYLHHLTGSWRAWLDAQTLGWGRGFHNPADAFGTTWANAHEAMWPDRPRVATLFKFEIITMALGVIVTLVCLVRRRWASAAFVGVQVVAFGTSSWYISASRAVLLWFPLFVLLAEAITRPWRRGVREIVLGLTFAAVLIDGLVMVWWAWLFFTSQWAG